MKINSVSDVSLHTNITSVDIFNVFFYRHVLVYVFKSSIIIMTHCWLSVVAVALFGVYKIEHCHTYLHKKMTCFQQDNNDLKNDYSYPDCKVVKELFPKNPEDVAELLDEFSDVRNVLVAGVSSGGALSFFRAFGITDIKDLYQDHIRYPYIAGSLEMVAGAARLAIENFCEEKGGLNYTFA